MSGLMLAQNGLACGSFFGEAALSAVDFCFLFDCQNGALGGLVQFCSNSFPVFVDCENVIPPEL
jgi:hypothetical protein